MSLLVLNKTVFQSVSLFIQRLHDLKLTITKNRALQHSA